ncbi:MAG: protein kinase [Myxococcota bacterium]
MTAQPSPSEEAAESPSIPQRLPREYVLGRYVIDGWVREGGMASLYRGHHVTTGATVAIKVQLSGDDNEVSAARFAREAEVIGRLSGVQNIVQVHDADDLGDGRRYVVMEWIEGDNLEELLDDIRNNDESMKLLRICRLMKDVALALDATHKAQVVHRDLKPSNIMIDRSHPDREIAKLVDFGISADLGTGGDFGDLTQAGVVLGTAGYMAPEQAVGLPAAPRMDIFAFGIVLFEMITGYRPPPGQVTESLPDVSTLRSRVPKELSALVNACICRNPKERPDGAISLVAQLDEAITALSGHTTKKKPAAQTVRVPPVAVVPSVPPTHAAVEAVAPSPTSTQVTGGTDPVVAPAPANAQATGGTDPVVAPRPTAPANGQVTGGTDPVVAPASTEISVTKTSGQTAELVPAITPRTGAPGATEQYATAVAPGTVAPEPTEQRISTISLDTNDPGEPEQSTSTISSRPTAGPAAIEQGPATAPTSGVVPGTEPTATSSIVASAGSVPMSGPALDHEPDGAIRTMPKIEPGPNAVAETPLSTMNGPTAPTWEHLSDTNIMVSGMADAAPLGHPTRAHSESSSKKRVRIVLVLGCLAVLLLLAIGYVSSTHGPEALGTRVEQVRGTDLKDRPHSAESGGFTGVSSTPPNASSEPVAQRETETTDTTEVAVLDSPLVAESRSEPVSSGDTTGSSELGPSSTTGELPELGSSSDEEGVSQPETPTPAPAPAPACRAIRRRAEAALAASEWHKVIRNTKNRRCWSPVERTRLRVEAYLQLRRYADCIREGTGYADSRVIKTTKFCRERLSAAGG